MYWDDFEYFYLSLLLYYSHEIWLWLRKQQWLLHKINIENLKSKPKGTEIHILYSFLFFLVTNSISSSAIENTGCNNHNVSLNLYLHHYYPMLWCILTILEKKQTSLSADIYSHIYIYTHTLSLILWGSIILLNCPLIQSSNISKTHLYCIMLAIYTPNLSLPIYLSILQ